MNTTSKKIIKGASFYTTLFCSIMLIFWLQSKYEKKRIEDNLNGVCRETNSILSFEELYNNAVYDYIKHEIEKRNKMIDKFERCYEDACGVYYTESSDFLMEVEKFYRKENNTLINLNNIRFDRKYFDEKKIGEIYSREYFGSGGSYLFTKIYTKEDKIIFRANDKNLKNGIGNYYIGFKQRLFDDNGKITSSYDISDYIYELDNCGNLAYFF